MIRVVLQVDFSENATIMSQNEIQSAHWNYNQATLFTAHAWAADKKIEALFLFQIHWHTVRKEYMHICHIFLNIFEKILRKSKKLTFSVMDLVPSLNRSTCSQICSMGAGV